MRVTRELEEEDEGDEEGDEEEGEEEEKETRDDMAGDCLGGPSEKVPLSSVMLWDRLGRRAHITRYITLASFCSSLPSLGMSLGPLAPSGRRRAVGQWF